MSDQKFNFISVKEAAERLGGAVTAGYVARACASGEIPHYKLARGKRVIEVSEFDAWVASRRQAPRAVAS